MRIWWEYVECILLNCDAGMCSDITAEAAAALAFASLTFKASNPALSLTYWNAAKKIYAMTGADTAFGQASFTSSTKSFPELQGFYNSTATVSHVFFGAAAMWKVCKQMNCPDASKYLGHALRYAVLRIYQTH